MVVTGMGGAILNALLLGEPQGFIQQDTPLLYFLCVWTLVAYSPFNIVHYLTGNVVFEVLAHYFFF